MKLKITEDHKYLSSSTSRKKLCSYKKMCGTAYLHAMFLTKIKNLNLKIGENYQAKVNQVKIQMINEAIHTLFFPSSFLLL